MNIHFFLKEHKTLRNVFQFKFKGMQFASKSFSFFISTLSWRSAFFNVVFFQIYVKKSVRVTMNKRVELFGYIYFKKYFSKFFLKAQITKKSFRFLFYVLIANTNVTVAFFIFKSPGQRSYILSIKRHTSSRSESQDPLNTMLPP